MTDTPLALEFLLLFVVVAGLVGMFLALRRRRPGDRAWQGGIAIALVALLLLFWVNGAVGIIGSSSNDANALYAGVPAVALVGALLARLRPGGMARAMLAATAVQIAIAVVALIAGLGVEGAAWPADLIAATAFFAGLWLASAWLFRVAEGRDPGPGISAGR